MTSPITTVGAVISSFDRRIILKVDRFLVNATMEEVVGALVKMEHTLLEMKERWKGTAPFVICPRFRSSSQATLDNLKIDDKWEENEFSFYVVFSPTKVGVVWTVFLHEDDDRVKIEIFYSDRASSDVAFEYIEFSEMIEKWVKPRLKKISFWEDFFSISEGGTRSVLLSVNRNGQVCVYRADEIDPPARSEFCTKESVEEMLGEMFAGMGIVNEEIFTIALSGDRQKNGWREILDALNKKENSVTKQKLIAIHFALNRLGGFSPLENTMGRGGTRSGWRLKKK